LIKKFYNARHYAQASLIRQDTQIQNLAILPLEHDSPASTKYCWWNQAQAFHPHIKN